VCNFSSGQCGWRTLLVSDVRRSCVIAGRNFECHLDHASHPSVRLPTGSNLPGVDVDAGASWWCALPFGAVLCR
jgi:hypothetical protein